MSKIRVDPALAVCESLLPCARTRADVEAFVYQERENRYRFVAAGREYHNGDRIGSKAEACDVARRAAAESTTPGLEYTVLEAGRFVAGYKLVKGRVEVRMP